MQRIARSTALAAALAVALVACEQKPGDGSAASTNAIDTATLAPGARPATPADTTAAVDSVTTQPIATHLAVISTSAGDIEIELYGKDAPKTVANFVGLAKKKYYDSIAFHRVIPGYMIQTGDPFSKDSTKRELWGNGGESIYGASFEDELDPSAPSSRRGYVTGTVAMANAGPNTNGSQFFIVHSTQGASHLPHNYSIFGMVRSGMDAVEKIAQTGYQGEKPITPARIRTITVKELPAAGSDTAKSIH